MSKKCAYCGFNLKDKADRRKMPNGLYACTDCYRHRNPMYRFGQRRAVWKMRKHLPPEQRAKLEAQGKPPPMHKVYSHPLIKAAYAMLKKNKKFSLPDLEGR